MNSVRRTDPVEVDLLFLECPEDAPMAYHHELASCPLPNDPALLHGREVGRFVPHTVLVHDGRKLAGKASLDREAFSFARHASAVQDFYDDAEVLATYYPEVSGIVAGHFADCEVLVVSHSVRTTRPGHSMYRRPSTFMHNDFTPIGAIKALQAAVTEQEFERRIQRRFAMVHVWRPIRGPLQTNPLLLADGTSFGPADLQVAVQHTASDREDEYCVVRHNPDQRWYYWPDMQPEEALVFKVMDTDPSVTRCCAHGAMFDPATPPEAMPRESIEARAFVFFPD